MNTDRRSALGLSLAALVGGVISTASAPPPNDDAVVVGLCSRLSTVGASVDAINACDRLSDEQEEAMEAELRRLFQEEDRLAGAICGAPPPRTVEGFSALARAAISVTPLEMDGGISWDHCTIKRLSEHLLRSLADRRLAP